MVTTDWYSVKVVGAIIFCSAIQMFCIGMSEWPYMQQVIFHFRCLLLRLLYFVLLKFNNSFHTKSNFHPDSFKSI